MSDTEAPGEDFISAACSPAPHTEKSYEPEGRAIGCISVCTSELLNGGIFLQSLWYRDCRAGARFRPPCGYKSIVKETCFFLLVFTLNLSFYLISQSDKRGCPLPVGVGVEEWALWSCIHSSHAYLCEICCRGQSFELNDVYSRFAGVGQRETPAESEKTKKTVLLGLSLSPGTNIPTLALPLLVQKVIPFKFLNFLDTRKQVLCHNQ